MKSRFALVFVLASGVLLGGTGMAMGVTALQGSDSASTTQYGGCEQASDPDCGDVLGSGASGGPEGSGVQAGPQQAAAATATSGTLPFTGYLALPVIALGVALVAGGLVLRRSSRDVEA